MEQCRGGCSHEMVKSPATAATMAYPMEEEKRSYSRISGINGNDGNVDDDVVRSNGNREERSRDNGVCRVYGLKSDKDGSFKSCTDHGDGSSRDHAIDISNDDFTCRPGNSENCLSFPLVTPCHGDEADKVSQDQAAEPIQAAEGSATRKRVFQRLESQNMSTSQVVNKRRRKQDRPTKCFLGLENEVKSEDGINSSEGVVHGALKEEVQNNKQRFTYQVKDCERR